MSPSNERKNDKIFTSEKVIGSTSTTDTNPPLKTS